MTDILLHHYDVSPFAEKARLLLGYKQLPWHSVEIPVVMPKPDLVALTGGYRRTPVLQIGCDVYCDTPLIARVLDVVAPARPIFHGAHAGIGIAAGRWFDRELFFAALSQLFHPAVAAASAASLGGPSKAAAFAQDRTQMMTGTPVRPPRSGDARLLVAQTLGQLEAQLSSDGPFLLGVDCGWVDLCAYHPLWALRRNTALVGQLAPYPNVLAWMERVAALGHGVPTPISSERALGIARASQPLPYATASQPGHERLALGDEVEISAADYALEPSRGRLVYVGPDELAIERSDERAGRVVVHFPRVGFRVKAPGGGAASAPSAGS